MSCSRAVTSQHIIEVQVFQKSPGFLVSFFRAWRLVKVNVSLTQFIRTLSRVNNNSVCFFTDVLAHKIHSNWGTDCCDIPCLQGIDNFTQCLDTLLRCKDYFMVFTSYEKKIHIFIIYSPLMPQYPHTKFPDSFPFISLKTSLENLIEDQSIFPLVIDDVWIKRKLMRVTLAT